MSVRAAALAGAALAAYDHVSGAAKPDLLLKAASGSLQVLSYRAQGPESPPFMQSTPWEALGRLPPLLRRASPIRTRLIPN